jgi:hypothetical protein
MCLPVTRPYTTWPRWREQGGGLRSLPLGYTYENGEDEDAHHPAGRHEDDLRDVRRLLVLSCEHKPSKIVEGKALLVKLTTMRYVHMASFNISSAPLAMPSNVERLIEGNGKFRHLKKWA